jgi:hypothetical protein
VPVQIAGCDSLTPSPEDLLLHLCPHISYQNRFAFGLPPSCDIAETISRFDSTLDWQTTAIFFHFTNLPGSPFFPVQKFPQIRGNAPGNTLHRRHLFH